MTEPTYEFKFLDRNAYPDDMILPITLAQLRRVPWSPTGGQPVLRVTGDRGIVLIAAERTKGVEVHAPGDNHIRVQAPNGGIVGVGIYGDIRVEIAATTPVLEAVEWKAEDRPRVPHIEIPHNGVVRDFVGVANVGLLHGQLISANGERPGRLVGIGENTARGKLVGVDITGIRGDLNPLGKLSVCSPDIESLYDLAYSYDRLAKWLAWFNRGFIFGPPEDEHVTPREMAHWFRDLNDTLGPMAVSASTRIAVRWCYTLLEHEAIKPRRLPQPGHSTFPPGRALQLVIESCGRWLHRCVGYGQRPSRALWCWMLTSAAVARWSAEIRPVEGELPGWFGRFREVALSPIGGVLQLGSQDNTQSLVHSGYEPVAYVLVGLPFIFFVISLREFFRSPLNPR